MPVLNVAFWSVWKSFFSIFLILLFWLFFVFSSSCSCSSSSSSSSSSSVLLQCHITKGSSGNWTQDLLHPSSSASSVIFSDALLCRQGPTDIVVFELLGSDNGAFLILLPPTIRSLLDLNGFGFLDVFPPSNLKSGLRKAKLKKETSENAEKKARLLPWNFDEQNGSKLMP